MGKPREPLYKRISEAAKKYDDEELMRCSSEAYFLEQDKEELLIDVVRVRATAFAMFIAFLVTLFVACRPGQ